MKIRNAFTHPDGTPEGGKGGKSHGTVPKGFLFSHQAAAVLRSLTVLPLQPAT